MITDIDVQPCLACDHPAIEALLDLSFGIARRTKTSYRLREGSSPLPGLCFVVRDAEVGLSGAISFWPLKIGDHGHDAVLLGPLAVHPQRRNLGVGLALMKVGLAAATRHGHKLAILVGDEPYYARVGFARLPEGRLILPGPVDPARFLFFELSPGALAGVAGLVLAPWRWRERSAAFAPPGRAEEQEQQAERQQA
jgi:predicted N-acetyltransferase YhbS